MTSKPSMLALPSLLLASALICTTHSALAITPPAYEQYQRGLQLEKNHQYREAEQAYRTSMGLDPYDSLTYIRLADLVAKDNRYDEAISLYQQALTMNPKDTMLHAALAHLWETKHLPERALAEYRTLLKSNPEYTYAYLAMARLYKSMNQPDKAIEASQQFLATYPKHEDAQRELARLHLGQKNFAQAAQTYETLKSQNSGKFKDTLAYGIALNNSDKPQEALAVFDQIQTPSAVLYEQRAMALEKLNRLSEAYNSYQQALEALPPTEPGTPDKQAELFLKLADLATSLDRSPQAVSNLTAYLRLHPENTKVSLALADLFVKGQDFGNAQRVYESALTMLPDSKREERAELMRNLAFASQMQGQQTQAVTWYETSLALEDNQQARKNLALAYHQQGQYDKALNLYRNLVSEDPNAKTLRQDMAQALLAVADDAYQHGDYPKALSHYQDAMFTGSAQETPALLGIANTQYALRNNELAYSTYQRVLQLDPDNILARINKAQLDIELKNYLAAVESLRWVVSKKPDSLEAVQLLATTHDLLGDYGQAALYYQQALQLKPHDATLLVGYGNSCRQMGDLNKAQVAYEAARQSTPQDPLVHYSLGSIYSLKNQLEDSRKAYQQALELNPGFTESYYGLGTTLEKQKKLDEALKVYQQYLEKAPSSAAYVPLAKQRVDILKKTMPTPTTTPAQVKPVSTGASPNARR